MTDASARQSTSDNDLDAVLTSATAASAALAELGEAGRAVALERIAAALDAAAGELIPLAHRETALPEQPRLAGELGRTTFQLRLFAEVLTDGGYLEATVDTARIRAGRRVAGPMCGGCCCRWDRLWCSLRATSRSRSAWPVGTPRRRSRPVARWC